MTGQDTSRQPGSPHSPSPDDLYTTPPPWDIGRPQPAFRALADAGALRGRVLDAGCGTGEHTLMAAALGLDATGVDLAAAALRSAGRKARERGLTARFLLQDARALAAFGEVFDTVLDCGLFHVFDAADRAAYVAGLRSVLRPGGRCHLLCFRDRQPADRWQHVHQVAADEIEAAFAGGWRVESIRPATISTTEPPGIPAWLASLTRQDTPSATTANALVRLRGIPEEL